MKRLKATMLLFCLLFPLAGTYLFLSVQKFQVRIEIREKILAGLDVSELVLLKFSNEDASKNLDWEHEGEFEYQGDMYDVIKRIQSGDTLYFWCWPDRQETVIKGRLKKLLASGADKSPMNKDTREKVQQIFKILFSDQPFDWKMVSNIETKITGFFYYDFYESPFLFPVSPPPKTTPAC